GEGHRDHDQADAHRDVQPFRALGGRELRARYRHGLIVTRRRGGAPGPQLFEVGGGARGGRARPEGGEGREAGAAGGRGGEGRASAGTEADMRRPYASSYGNHHSAGRRLSSRLTYFTCTISRRPARPWVRPTPLSRTPPQGAVGSP